MDHIQAKILKTVDSLASILKPGSPYSHSKAIETPEVARGASNQKNNRETIEGIYEDLLLESELKRILQFHQLSTALTTQSNISSNNIDADFKYGAITPLQCSNITHLDQEVLEDIDFDNILVNALRDKFRLQKEIRVLHKMLQSNQNHASLEIYEENNDAVSLNDLAKNRSFCITAMKCKEQMRQLLGDTVTSTKFNRLKQFLGRVEHTNDTIIQRLESRFDELSSDNDKRIEKATQCRQNIDQHDIDAYSSHLTAMKATLSTLTSDYQKEKELLETELTYKRDELINSQNQVKALEKRVLEQFERRKHLQEQLFDCTGNLRVYCRIKPFKNDAPLGIEYCTMSNTIALIKKQSHLFQFLRLFPPNSNQEIVFDEFAQLISSAIDGYNVTIMTYGQTGSGKTFTMNGTITCPGIIPRTLTFLLDNIDSSKVLNKEINLLVSIYEVYNENIYDLLSPQRSTIQIRNSSHTEIILDNKMEVPIMDFKEGIHIIRQACNKRQCGAHAMNTSSSRSHQIVQFILDRPGSTKSDKEPRTVVNLIDLAGSERLSKTKTEGVQLMETQNINQSLSILGSVINALQNHKNRSHIPYRDSKLTFLLRDYIKPETRGKVGIIINIAAEEEHMNETKSSLYFGQRCSKVKLGKVRKVIQA